MPDWKTFGLIKAPCREAKSELTFRVSQEFVDTNYEVSRLTPLFQASTHLFGTLPEINLISRVRDAVPTPVLTTLADAYACFEGIQRPHNQEENGETVLIYVLRPNVTIERFPSMACQARAIVPPSNSVLTVLVRGLNLTQEDGSVIDGEVTRVEWVIAEGEDKLLPKNAESRYKTEHWIR